MRTLETLKQSFRAETGMSLYKAFELYWLEVGTIILDDEPLQYQLDQDEQALIETINTLKKFTTAINSNRERRRIEALEYSIPRSTTVIARRGKLDYYAEELIDNSKVKHALLKNKTVCFNPVLLLNGWLTKECKCIFTPSKSFVKENDFISPVYVASGTRILHYIIDIDMLKSIWNINIDEADILKINYGMYHPLIWGFIQSNNFNLLLL